MTDSTLQVHLQEYESKVKAETEYQSEMHIVHSSGSRDRTQSLRSEICHKPL